MLRRLAPLLILPLTLRAEPLPPDALPAEPAAAAFVRANLVSGLYHEVGHALIDVLGLPPVAEEDAADAFAALMIDRLWPEPEGNAILQETALAFRLYAAAEGHAPGPHSLDVVRYDNLVCLYFGADPQGRAALADALDLAPQRRERCPGAYEAAATVWGDRLAGMPPQDHGPGLRMVRRDAPGALSAVVAAEVARLNGEIGWPVAVEVSVEPCGEANAFYDPRARRIVICTDYAAGLARLRAGNE